MTLHDGAVLFQHHRRTEEKPMPGPGSTPKQISDALRMRDALQQGVDNVHHHEMTCRRCGLLFAALNPNMDMIDFPVCPSCRDFIHTSAPNQDAVTLGIPPGDPEARNPEE